MIKEKIDVWEGVYNSFEVAMQSIHNTENPFDTNIWLDKQQGRIVKQFDQLNTDAFIAENAISKDYPLPLMVAFLLTLQNHVSILDMGGGMGSIYLELLSKIPNSLSKIFYTIIEKQSTCSAFPRKAVNLPNLTFSDNIDSAPKNVDIIHIGSTLHYIEDWKALLDNLVEKCNPKYIIFSDLLAGDIPTFVSLQNYYGRKIPVWFWNIVDFNATIVSLGCDLIYKTFYKTNILNEDSSPNGALPETHRIAQTVNLIYSLKKKTHAE